jgi:5'-methylthioadenosine phosphorylase
MVSNGFRNLATLGIIGGSGLYELLEEKKHLILNTPFGKTPRIEIGYIEQVKVAFLPRHAKPGSLKVSHAVTPSAINYRANIYGLRMLGVNRIYSTNAVGAINPKLAPGDLVIVDQVIDMTKRREATFFDGKAKVRISKEKLIGGVVHVDFSNPYCQELRSILVQSCRSIGFKYRTFGTYVCTEGPRFETPAEIAAYRILGSDVVGMTNYPECILSRELLMCYSSVAMCTNYAAGTGPEKITHEEVDAVFKTNINRVQELIRNAVVATPTVRKCNCENALTGAQA